MKNDLPVTIRRMGNEDIPEVVRIHRDVLPTASARMGGYVLSGMYATLLAPGRTVAYVAVSGMRVVGAVTATTDARATASCVTAFLKTPRALFAVASAILTGTVGIAELIIRSRTEREILASFPAPLRMILTVVVAKDSQSLGIGSRLLERLYADFDGATVHVDTDTENAGARRFYERQGFTRQRIIGPSVVYAKILPGKPGSRHSRVPRRQK